MGTPTCTGRTSMMVRMLLALFATTSTLGCDSRSVEYDIPDSDERPIVIVIENFTEPVPEAIQYGNFTYRDKCLILHIGSVNYFPVFLSDSASPIVKDISVEMSSAAQSAQRYEIGGGSVARSTLNNRLSDSQKELICQDDIFIVTKVSKRD